MAKPYNTAAVFAGGGLRFGYYLGMYQALCEAHRRPDVIIASCGGAFAAALLELACEPQVALALLKSHTVHQMFCRFYGVVPERRVRFILPAIGRLMLSRWQGQGALSQSQLDALTRHALFAIRDEQDYPLWQDDAFSDELAKLSIPNHSPIVSLIVASRLVTSDDGYRWQQLVRPSSAVSAQARTLLDTMSCALHELNRARICADVALLDTPLSVAVRASISDMYYLPPYHWQGQTLCGGVLDLTPVELAHRLADVVYIDDKCAYDRWLAVPAIRQVFGFDANARLKDARAHPHTHWLPLAGNRTHTQPLISKRYHTDGYIAGRYPSYGEYTAICDSQWHYGYERTQQYLQGKT